MKEEEGIKHTPVRTSNHSCIRSSCSHTTCDAEVSQLDSAIFVGQDVCSLDIAVDDTLVMEIDQPLKDL